MGPRFARADRGALPRRRLSEVILAQERRARPDGVVGFAERDELAPMPTVKEPSRLFLASGPAGELDISGVHHGFTFPERRVYNKPGAERHWERLIALYRRRLG